MTKAVRFTDKSVRDLPQQAILKDDLITIVSKVGRKIAEKYTISLSEWLGTEKHCNPFWAKFELVNSHTLHYDEQPGGCGQADRLRDSQIRAIDNVIRKAKINEQEYCNTIR